ncbi:MAG TPA: tail fiber domain-containing protein [Verrucomicrobiae bacterium]|nr:tail fiber domain-containing protein [Verrucomicrobiae bacterium]
MEIKVNGQRALRLEPNTNAAPNVIGGSEFNYVEEGRNAATIGGGKFNTIHADEATVGGGLFNSASGHSATVGGGFNNQSQGPSDTVSGGINNSASGGIAGVSGGQQNKASGFGAVVGGGEDNMGSGSHSVVSGGRGNSSTEFAANVAGGAQNVSSGVFANVGGGQGNHSGGQWGAIGGGFANTNSGFGATIAGGIGNVNGGSRSTVGGGDNNAVGNVSWATIPGGWSNRVTASLGFAAGRRAQASHVGAFVWGDSTDATIASTNADSVTMRASGGYRLFTDSTAITGAFLASGSGSWTSMSDRNSKENFDAIDATAVLEKVVALPVQTWNYKSQDANIRHIGPTAQDFKSAFGVGENDTGISNVDADGVALAAIQGLNQKLEAARAENAKLTTRLEQLEALVRRLSASR